MAVKSQTQRTLLTAFIASIVCCGAVGIYCLVAGTMSSLEGKILATTAVFGGVSILGMASAVPWERRRWHPIGPLGFISTAWAALMLLILIWYDGIWREDWFMKLMGISCVAAVAFPHVGLLSLARLKCSYWWVLISTVTSIALLGGWLCVLIVFELDTDMAWRVTGVLAILVVCGTLVVPILHRVSAIHTREGVRTVELFVSLTCPRCSSAQRLSVGRSKCSNCGLRFLIEIDEDNCPTCGYPLYQLQSATCPECGTPIATTT